MTYEAFKKLRDNFDKNCELTLLAKGKEYTVGSDDRLANFKSIAKRLGLHPLEVWAVYMNKHIDSIMNFIKEEKVYSEPIASRFLDARNYIDLGYALVVDSDLESYDEKDLT